MKHPRNVRDLMTIAGVKRYKDLLANKVLEILVSRVSANKEPTTNDETTLITLKEQALNEVFSNKLTRLKDQYSKISNDIAIAEEEIEGNDQLTASEAPDRILNEDNSKESKLQALEEKVNKIVYAIQQECKYTSFTEVREYFNNKTRQKDADNIYFIRRLQEMRSSCPLSKDDPDADNIFAENLEKLRDIYGLTKEEAQYIAMYIVQCHNKLWDKRADYPILLALFGKQGNGKSELGKAICSIINMEDRPEQYNIDDILGQFGTLDVGTKPAILLNEFGRGIKENVDALKRYVDGGTISINRKFRDALPVNVISSFILATNTDPTFLYGSELTSRRIMVVNMDRSTFNGTLDDTRECIRQMWTHITNNTLGMLNIDPKSVVLSKANNDLETAFIEFLTTLDNEQLQAMSMMLLRDKWSVGKFKKEFAIQSKTTASAYLGLEMYFERRKYSKSTYYVATEQLRALISKIINGDPEDDPEPDNTPDPNNDKQTDGNTPEFDSPDDPTTFQYSFNECGMAVCDSTMSPPRPVITENTQFIVTGIYTDEYLNSDPEQFDRKGEHLIPTALVYESDNVPLDEQKRIAARITNGQYRDNIMWVTESGGKSVHTLVKISEEDGKQIKKLNCMKEVWKSVGKKVFGSIDNLDSQCASIGRLSRLPNGVRDNGNKQTCLYVNKNAAPFPLTTIFERVRFEQRNSLDIKPLIERGDGIDEEYRTLENYHNSNPDKWQFVYDVLVNGETPASGSPMINGIKLLNKAQLYGLRDRFHDICHKAHPSNIPNRH